MPSKVLIRDYNYAYKLIGKLSGYFHKIVRYFINNFYDDLDHQNSITFIKEIMKGLIMNAIEEKLDLGYDDIRKKLLENNDATEFVKNIYDISAENMKSDLDKFIKHLEDTMEKEIEATIADTKAEGRKNRRNGYRSRIIKTTYGEAKLRVPRDRAGKYFPKCIAKYCKETVDVAAELMRAMQEEGTQSAAIKQVLRRVNMWIPRTIVRRLWDILAEQSKKVYEEREFQEHYDALMFDGTYVWVACDENGNRKTWTTIDQITGEVKVHRKAIKRCVLTMYGIDLKTGKKTDLGFHIAEAETVEAYEELIKLAKAKGLKSTNLIISDKHAAIRTATKNCFGDIEFQQCFAHASRELKGLVTGRKNKCCLTRCLNAVKYNYDGCEEMIGMIVNEMDVSEAIKEMIFDWFDKNWETLNTFHKYPVQYWDTIYTSNFIESQNKRIKSLCKTKGCNYSVTTLSKSLYISKTNRQELINCASH